MEPTFRPQAHNPDATPWDDSGPSPDRFAPPAILLVEDDPDIRAMLATLLDLAGFNVEAYDTAERGLNALRESEFDLILTDYALPRHSGVWLLEHADAEGLIDGTPVLIVTAHPQVEGAHGYEVIQKPFDLDELIEKVRYRVEGEGARRSPDPAGRSRSSDGGERGWDSAEPVELILYVRSTSPRSSAAVRKIRKALKGFTSSRVTMTVCDLARKPSDGEADATAFTPMLVRKTPGPHTFILGHVTNPELVLEVVASCQTPKRAD